MVGDPAWTAEAAKWIGAPYRAGGANREGMDELGLIRRIYENVARIRISSGLEELSRTGVEIPREQLRPGDLVFFGDPQIQSAGIFLGENRIVTATPAFGVVYAQLTEPPFAESYRTARRLLR
jgi:lipoprotein Spr